MTDRDATAGRPPVDRDPASADLEEVLDHLSALVEEARALPMSSSCVVHRGEVLDLVDEARRVLPAELLQARRTLAERDALLEQARTEAERTLEDARAERDRLVSEGQARQDHLVQDTTVWVRAQDDASRLLDQTRADADRMLDQAHAEAEAMRLQTEDYVDGKLASFEHLLSTTLATVSRGRERLGRTSADDPADEQRAAVPDAGPPSPRVESRRR
jgi:cell division septum initiation protein DivIVA